MNLLLHYTQISMCNAHLITGLGNVLPAQTRFAIDLATLQRCTVGNAVQSRVLSSQNESDDKFMSDLWDRVTIAV